MPEMTIQVEAGDVIQFDTGGTMQVKATGNNVVVEGETPLPGFIKDEWMGVSLDDERIERFGAWTAVIPSDEFRGLDSEVVDYKRFRSFNP